MNSFLFAVNAVAPIIIIVAIGYVLKRIGLIKPPIAAAMNKLVFRLLLPCMLFLNVYKIENIGDIDFGYVFYAIGTTLAFFALSIPLAMKITKDNPKRGAIIQAVFRSNYALVGIPLATSLYGDEGGIIATVLSAFIIPTFNALAVICLSIFGGKGKIDVKRIVIGILKNPLIDSIALGGVMLLIRALFVRFNIDFRLTDIKPVYSVLSQLSATATPIALLVLGAQFEFSAIPGMKKEIIITTGVKTTLIPTLAIGLAYILGCFDGAHFAAFVALFATPVAVSSVPMAQEMGADHELAGQLVVWTTLISAFSIFIISFILKAIGVFPG